MNTQHKRQRKTGSQVCHTGITDIAIPFQPLLREIAHFFQFNEPEFKLLDETRNTVCVTLKAKHDNTELVYIQESNDNFQDPREPAALTAIQDMIVQFKIIVKDFTYHNDQETERCCRLYRLKRIELEQIAQHAPLTELEEEVPRTPQGYTHIDLDYMSILKKIFNTITIKCTKMRTLEHYPGSYTSWITIDTPHNHPNNRKIIGPRSTTLVSAKDYLARKVINYLIEAYNLRIVDVNYGTTESKSTEIMMELERGSYLTTRALLFGEPEEPLLTTIIEEEDGLSIEGVISYTPPPHLQLTVSDSQPHPQQTVGILTKRVLCFENA